MEETFKLSKSMRKKYINKRFAVVEMLKADEHNNNDIIDETPMDIVLDDESIAVLSTVDQYWNSNAFTENRIFLEENDSHIKKFRHRLMFSTTLN